MTNQVNYHIRIKYVCATDMSHKNVKTGKVASLLYTTGDEYIF